jgi:ketosteroid isomerase-like protein
MPEHTAPDLEEALGRSMEAFNRRDFDAAMTLYTPDAVWDMSHAGMGEHERREGIRALLEEWRNPYEEFEQVLEEFRNLGSGVTLTATLQRARLIGSSAYIEVRYWAVLVWVDGLVQRFAPYTTADEARANAERLAQERNP